MNILLLNVLSLCLHVYNKNVKRGYLNMDVPARRFLCFISVLKYIFNKKEGLPFGRPSNMFVI